MKSCRDCPHIKLEGGRVSCNHPKASSGGYIISHLKLDTDVPKECPLLKENKE